VKKALEMFEELSANKADYAKFYDQFSKNLKLAVHDQESSGHRKKIAELLRFYSTKSGDEMTSLKDYVTRMKEGQKSIYYISGESRAQLETSPFIEAATKRGYEVLMMTDPIDEYAMQQMRDFEDKKFVCLSKEGVKFDETEEEKKSKEEEKASFEPVLKAIKDTLGDKIEKVQLSDRLTNSPCVLVTGEFGWSANMERIMRAQALRDNSSSTYMISKKTMEVNPTHPIMLALRDRVSKEGQQQHVRDLIMLLFDTSLLVSGFSLEDPSSYASRIHRMIKLGLSIEDEPEAPAAATDAAAADGADAAASPMETVD